jgi:hypothetical protein
MHKPSTPSTPFIHGDDVIGGIYSKKMVLIPYSIDCWAKIGPMLQAFLTTTHHPCQPWRTTHNNTKYHHPNANLMCKQASQPQCPLGKIHPSTDLQWSPSTLPTCHTFFNSSYTAPTPSLHTLQLLKLSMTKEYSLVLLNATCMF